MTKFPPPPPPPSFKAGRRRAKHFNFSMPTARSLPPADEAVFGAAIGHHQRRVTLNLISRAACCPDDLAVALLKLEAADWRLDSLDRVSLETVYAYVDDALAEKAKAEFVAAPGSIVDHRASNWSCGLCGHKNCRWEFTLRNVQGGRDHHTGSTCIIEYGIHVEGSATAEEARAMLTDAVTQAKRKAIAAEWQTAHPNHAKDLRAVADVLRTLRVSPAWGLYQHLKPQWKKRAKAVASKLKAIHKFYRRNKFLTDNKTIDLYGTDDLPGHLALGRAMLDEYANAEARRDGKGPATADPIDAWWAKFLTDHPRMNNYQRSRIERMRSFGDDPNDLRFAWQTNLIAEIRDQHTPTAAPPATVDNSDLPF